MYTKDKKTISLYPVFLLDAFKCQSSTCQTYYCKIYVWFIN